MKVLWQRKAPAGVEEVISRLPDPEKWQVSTVKTLLNRLLRKGAIKAQQDGRRYLYSPLMAHEQWVSDESLSLLDRLFGGRVAPLVAHFSQTRKLSKKDIADLKRLIRELDDGR
jgi:predicted transcriptional regulator